ncbi:MAG: OprD family porin [Sulfurovum sp.]|nr:OprD family porin [Sulfurovum sp.]
MIHLKQLTISFLMIMSITSYSTGSENILMLNTKPYTSTQSIRGALGAHNTTVHTEGELRTGYITFKKNGAQPISACALGGHMHVDTERWNGMMIALSAYTVLNPSGNQNPLHQNSDFFDNNGKGFSTLSEAFIDAKWKNTHIKLGRQTLDTPLVDADDIRMIPNYFTAYTITNTAIENLMLAVGLIDKMAGWENGVNASEFVNISQVLGANEETDGVYYMSISYEGIQDTSLSLWYYRYDNIEDILYAEADYTQMLSKSIVTTLGLQYAHGQNSGRALLGAKDASTFGANIKINFQKRGTTLMVAYNKDNGQTGAIDLSLGGGPFFTSMEDQTIDAIAGEGAAWMGGLTINIPVNTTFGVYYGMFRSDTLTTHYHASETDLVIKYSPNNHITLTAVYALIKHKDDNIVDHNQFRFIGNYSF